MKFSDEINEKIELLQQKYAALGQDMPAYLDGLLNADFLTYWDYIHLDTLLSLQTPKTSLPDEEIFIMYHQITELYFKLTLHECNQICNHPQLGADFFCSRLKRINAYFTALTTSFEVMVDGMEKAQFLKFRMSLLPASGFQSAQYRLIEIAATDFGRLVQKEKRESLQTASIVEQFEHIYWKFGATELATGKQTLTLKQFIKKYGSTFLEFAKDHVQNNFAALYHKLDGQGNDLNELANQMRRFDMLANVNWPLVHYKSAVRYLDKKPSELVATGGTNWQKYLPPRFQKRIFYPFLFTESQLADWGKAWVMDAII
ncbi:tryptophan 2,3-dioxygenase [Pedobacter sp. UYEF25]